MIKLPHWAEIYLDDNGCPNCGEKLSSAELLSVGIRKSQDGKPRLCFDSVCQKCNERCSTTLVTNFDLEAHQLVSEILSAYGGESMIEVVQNRKFLPPGRDREEFEKDFERFKEFMNSNNCFYNLLKFCGLSDREIRNP